MEKAKHPAYLLRGSLVSPSLEAGIITGNYVNATPLARLEKLYQQYNVLITRQNMANWTILCAERYLPILYDYLHKYLYRYHVIQADETPLLVNKDGRPAVSKSYMWVYRTGKYQMNRRYDEAVKALPKSEQKMSLAYLALSQIQQIYHEECKLQDMTLVERRKHRQKFIKPLVDAYFNWIRINIDKVMPKSKTYNGMAYSLN